MKDVRVGVIGLGYVGLPLAVAFSRHFEVVGYDSDSTRIAELVEGRDRTNEVELASGDLGQSTVRFSDELDLLESANFYCVCVPTPIDDDKKPNLGPLEKACKIVASVLSKGDIVVFESTVFPGATEEISIPLLEKCSALKVNVDFAVGYSPERINPGDSDRKLESIVKVVSASSPETVDVLEAVYGSIIKAGIHRAPSIKVAEAAKIIENTQRDLNIALINDLASFFNRLNIDTHQVLEAASTKWNFHRFEPGLVGGHCIGVDPYYLTYKALQVGHSPDLILAGRKVNDSMAEVIVIRLFDAILALEPVVFSPKILIMGYAFKENCPDFRNTLVSDLVNSILYRGGEVLVYDPWVSVESLSDEVKKRFVSDLDTRIFDGIVIAVQHDCFREIHPQDLLKRSSDRSCIFDVKSFYDSSLGFQRL